MFDCSKIMGSHQGKPQREKCPYSEIFGSVFGVFRIRIQPECAKIPTRKTPDTDTFHAVYISGNACKTREQ